MPYPTHNEHVDHPVKHNERKSDDNTNLWIQAVDSSAERFKVFSDGESLTSTNSSGGTDQCTLVSHSEEYNAIHHYEDANGNWVDVDPEVGNAALYNEITNYNRYWDQNESQKIIKVIRSNIIEEVVGAYKKAISE